MASYSKFQQSSSNLSGSSSADGHHESCKPFLGRSGSLREGTENRIPSTQGTTNSISLSPSNKMGGIFHSLLTDWKAMTLDQKLTRQGELKKILSFVRGISSEDYSSARMKLLPSSAGELKRAKITIQDSSNRARDRAKYFSEAASKIDKYCSNSLPRKRIRKYFLSNERSDGLQPGVSMTKNRSQVHSSASDINSGNQGPEERIRASIPIRRPRTSAMEMQTERANVSIKPCGQMVRDKERLKLVSRGACISEESAQALPTGDDRQKSKMKKKKHFYPKSGASEIDALAKPPSSEQPMKQGMQPRPSGSEDNSVASHAASPIKTNAASRVPRSSATLLKASTNVPQTLRDPNDAVISAGDHKRSIATRSSSPSMTQLLGQRLQKMSHTARQENLPPKSVKEDIPFSESIDVCALSGDHKLKNEFTFSGGLSESEEPSFTEIRPKHKIRRCHNLEEKDVHNLPKGRNFVFEARNSKVTDKDGQHMEDSNKIQQRHGHEATTLKCGMPNAIEKPKRDATMNQIRCASFSSEKFERKAGHLASTKSRERKRHVRHRNVNHSNSMDCYDETIDNHKELLAAANYALRTRYSCSDLFWKKFEPIFSLLSVEDTAYLKQQIQLVDEYSKVGYLADDGEVDPRSNSLLSMSALDGKADQHGLSDTVHFGEFEQMLNLDRETGNFDQPNVDNLVDTKGHYGISICQALLSAMIEEDENKSFFCNGREEHFDKDTCHVQPCVDADRDAKNINLLQLDISQTVKNEYSNDCGINACLHYYDEHNNLTVENDDINQMSIEDIIFLELKNIGLYPEPVPDLAYCDEGIDESIDNLKRKLNEKVMLKKKLLVKLEKMVVEAMQVSERELERISLDKLVEIAYEKYTPIWGANASGGENMSRNTKRAVHSFVQQTLARCKTFEKTGKSCFSEPPFQDIFRLDNNIMEHKHVTADDRIHLKMQGGAGNNKLDKCVSDCISSFNHLSKDILDKEKCTNNVKRRELTLSDMAGCDNNTSFRPHLGLENLASGRKGKRSERDKDRKRRNKGDAVGWSAVSPVKVERKNKRKSKHLATHSSASLNFRLDKTSGIAETIPDSDAKENKGSSLLPSVSGKDDAVSNTQAADFSNLQLPEVDAFGVASNEPDLGSWLNFEEDGFQDDGSNGLEIPMDDLTDLNMMI